LKALQLVRVLLVVGVALALGGCAARASAPSAGSGRGFVPDLVGGLGFAPAGNIGSDAAMFEAVHGTAADIAGKGVANPIALMLSACLMLDHLGKPEEATRIRLAIDRVVRSGEACTHDMGGKSGTREFTDALCSALG
jgi:isocitrate dehydrogenase (NAD+)